jgi:hypothetical protein
MLMMMTGSELDETDASPLLLFRLMVGINAPETLGFAGTTTRPAANLGLYARVVHAEQKSKDSYKVFSAVINACFFLQIIVAAALTAMGAAGVGHAAITAFGAINTVIAGFLTFLKGSGLPNRLKYFGDRWKALREFIEQRERDFTRPGKSVADVFEMVAVIEKMYNDTKDDIEVNTPDGYNSRTLAGRSTPAPGMARVGSLTGGTDGAAPRPQSSFFGDEKSPLGGPMGSGGPAPPAQQQVPPHTTPSGAGGFDMSKVEGMLGKLHSLDGTVRHLRDRFGGDHHNLKRPDELVREASHHLAEHERQIQEQIVEQGKAVAREVDEQRKTLSREASHIAGDIAEAGRDRARTESQRVVKQAGDTIDKAWE